MLHPVVCSPIITPLVDVLHPVAWRAGSSGAGQTLAQRLTAEYGVIAAGRYTDWTTGRLRATVSDDLDFAYAAGTVAADGSTQAEGLAPLHAGRGVLHDASRTNRLSGDATQARTASLTSGTVYTLWVSSGSATCSYGTATAATPLTFTATATATVTFTPTGVTRWMLTATAFPTGYYIAPGATTVATYGTTTTGVSLPAPVGGDVWNALDGEPDGVELDTTAFATLGTYTDGVFTDDTSTGVHYVKFSYSALSDKIQHYIEIGNCVHSWMWLFVGGYANGSVWVDIQNGVVGNQQSGISNVVVKKTATGVTIQFDKANIVASNSVSVAPVDSNGSTSGYVGTGEVSFIISDVSIQKLQPAEMTLIVDDVRLAGGGDVASNSTVIGIGPAYGPIYYDATRVIKSYDNMTFAAITDSWSRNDNIISIVNVRNKGTWQFRANYVNLTLGQTALAQTDEQGWVTYDGSFNPDAALQKLMFHYLNAYPGYLRRYVVCNRNLTGAETMKLLTKDFTVPAYA